MGSLENEDFRPFKAGFRAAQKGGRRLERLTQRGISGSFGQLGKDTKMWGSYLGG